MPYDGSISSVKLPNNNLMEVKDANIRDNAVRYDTAQTKTNAEKTQARDNISTAGENVTGKSYTIDGSTYTAGTGAEVFNDYTNNKAVGQYSHAEGRNTIAEYDYSHAEGYYTTARLMASHAEGWATEAGYAAHAEGRYTIASGDGAHAEGYGTPTAKNSARGLASHVEGCNTIAEGDQSHAEGLYTTAQRKSQHVEGEYNVLDTDGTTSTRGKFAHIIGNGTADNARSNALAVDWDGKIYTNNSTYGVDVVTTTDYLAYTGVKNVLRIMPTSVVDAGVTFIVGNTRAVNVNGTGTGVDPKYYSDIVLTLPDERQADELVWHNAQPISAGTYTVRGTGYSDSNLMYRIRIYQNSEAAYTTKTVYQDEDTFTVTGTDARIHVILSVSRGAAISNYDVYPMIRNAEAAPDGTYQMYAESNAKLTNLANYISNNSVKNLFKPTIEDIIPTTSGGFQLVVNEDGSVTTSGTSSTEIWPLLGRFIPEKTGYYLFSSGIPQTSYSTKSYLYTTANNASVYASPIGTRVLLEAGTIYDIKLDIKANYANNETYYPMIRSCDVTDYTYQPYAMSNVDLTHEVNTVANTGVKNLVRYNLTVPAELKASINADGSITVTASSTTNIRRLTIATDLSGLVDGKTYILSGCTGGNSVTTYHLGITKSNYAGLIYQTTRETVFQKTSEMALLVLTVRSGQSWTKTFYPMIREATITDEKFRAYALPNPELTACELSDINNNGVNLFNIYRWDSTLNAVVTDIGDEKINVACNNSSSSLEAKIKYYTPKLIPKTVYRVTLFVDSLTVTSGENPVIQSWGQSNSGSWENANFLVINSTISEPGVYTWDVSISNATYPGLEILILMAKNMVTTSNMDFRLVICERSHALVDPTHRIYSEPNSSITQMTVPQYRRGPLTDAMLPTKTSVIFGYNASVAEVPSTSSEFVVVRTYSYNFSGDPNRIIAVQIAEFSSGVRKTRYRKGDSWNSWV